MSQEEIVGQFAQAKPVHEDVTAVRVCATCEGTYSSERAYKRHFGTKAHRLATGGPLTSTFTCGLCDKHFTRSSDLKRHQTQRRCPSRLGAQHPPSTVLGKRAFDMTTQPLEEQKALRRLSPISALDEPALGSHQAGSSCTPLSHREIGCDSRPTDGAGCRQSTGPLVAVAEEAWQVATSEQSTPPIAKPTGLQDSLKRLTKIGEQHVISALASATQEVSPFLDFNQPGVLSNDLPVVLEDGLLSDGMLSEAFTPGRLYGAGGVMIDYEWVDDLPGHYDLMDLDAFQDDADEFAAEEHELGRSGSQRSTIMESATMGTGPEDTSRPSSVSIDDCLTQQEPLESFKRRLQHILQDPVVLPPRRVQYRQLSRLRLQPCGLCKKPYEKDGMALRQHLEAHLTELRAEQATHFCKVCQVGFVRQQDFEHHNNAANSGKCCGLPSHHLGSCKGYLCGFHFKHNAPCNGHHPPTDSSTAWSDHDRFKFGHLLRKWELSQLRVTTAEANKVQRLRQNARCVSSISAVEHGLRRRLSGASYVTSIVSWYSEPCRDVNIEDLQFRLSNLNIMGQHKGPRGNPFESTDKHWNSSKNLVSALMSNDHHAMPCYTRRGATIHDDPRSAAVRGQCAAVETLLAHGAHSSLKTIYEIMKSVNTAVLPPLVQTAQNLVTVGGVRMLHVAINYGCDTLVSMLFTKGVDNDDCLGPFEADELREWLTVDAILHDPRLRADALPCYTESMQTPTTLLAGQAYSDAVGFRSSTLDPLMSMDPLMFKDGLRVRAILAVDNSVAPKTYRVDDGKKRGAVIVAHDIAEDDDQAGYQVWPDFFMTEEDMGRSSVLDDPWDLSLNRFRSFEPQPY
ncbi:hypothetical protein LTR17_009506 [Elasticomyces elasticus]|nr:hypothetical protein LTR17_009506 [Elasticomyces elasticus]